MIKLKKTSVFVIVLVSNVLFSQETSTKNLGDFDTVKVFDRISVQLIPSTTNKITLSGANSQEVQIVNNNGELKVRMPLDKLLSGEDVDVVIYYKKLNAIEASEGAKVNANTVIKAIEFSLNAKEGAIIKTFLDVEKASIKVASGGVITVSGSTQNQDIVISTGGILNAKNFKSNQATISINAGGSADIFASSFVDAKVRAGGEIYIYGKPKQINQKTVLGGTIKTAN